MTQTELVLNVYRLWHRYDLGYEDLHMTFASDIAEPMVWLDCSDSFAWGTADAEEVATEADYELLEQCVYDCVALHKYTVGFDVAILYAARQRDLMPMPPRMKTIDEPLHTLFEGLPANENWG